MKVEYSKENKTPFQIITFVVCKCYIVFSFLLKLLNSKLITGKMVEIISYFENKNMYVQYIT